jgi:fluoride exporter
MMKYVLIAAGGAFGSVLRFAMQGGVQRLAGGSLFPWGTLGVNVLGCLLIGFLGAMFAGPVLVREDHRFGLTVGILGGFTTFSTFGLETFNLANDGQFRLAAANVMLSCGLGFAGVWAGYRTAEWWFGV